MKIVLTASEMLWYCIQRLVDEGRIPEGVSITTDFDVDIIRTPAKMVIQSVACSFEWEEDDGTERTTDSGRDEEGSS